MLHELKEHWEFHYWSEHVPNDSVEEVSVLIDECAKLYSELLMHLMPPKAAGTLSPIDYYFKIKEHSTYTTVVITETQGDVLW